MRTEAEPWKEGVRRRNHHRRLEQARQKREAQHRFWLKRGELFRERIAEGWSTYWLARSLNLEPRAVREMRAMLEGGLTAFRPLVLF